MFVIEGNFREDAYFMLLLVEIDSEAVALHERLRPWFAGQLRLQFSGQRLEVLQHVAHRVERIHRSHQVCHIAGFFLAVRLIELRAASSFHVPL